MVAVIDRELYMEDLERRSIFDLCVSDLDLWLMSSMTMIWLYYMYCMPWNESHNPSAASVCCREEELRLGTQ